MQCILNRLMFSSTRGLRAHGFSAGVTSMTLTFNSQSTNNIISAS